MTTPLHSQHCRPQHGPAIDDVQQIELWNQLKGWKLDGSQPGGDLLEQTFAFADFHRTMAFVNAVAWIAHEQDHHPELSVSHSRCTVRWQTHSVKGLSLNDFICAARVDQLLA